VGRDQPHLLDGLAAPAQEFDSAGNTAALFDAGLVLVNDQQADFTDGALGDGHGWDGAENTDQTPRRCPLARGEHHEPCVSSDQWEPKRHAAEGFPTTRPASPQWQRCKCHADSSPRPLTRGAGSPGIEEWPSCSRRT